MNPIHNNYFKIVNEIFEAIFEYIFESLFVFE